MQVVLVGYSSEQGNQISIIVCQDSPMKGVAQIVSTLMIVSYPRTGVKLMVLVIKRCWKLLPL